MANKCQGGRTMESLEYFRKDHVYITGKHAAMVDHLWTLNQVQDSYFKRLIDLYIVAAVIGLKDGNKVPADRSEGQRRIDMKQLVKCLSTLETIMQTVLLIDGKDTIPVEKRIDRAFHDPKTEEEYAEHMELFNAYARRGIEILDERLVQRGLTIEDEYTDVRVGNIMAMLNDSEYRGEEEGMV